MNIEEVFRQSNDNTNGFAIGQSVVVLSEERSSYTYAWSLCSWYVLIYLNELSLAIS